MNEKDREIKELQHQLAEKDQEIERVKASLDGIITTRAIFNFTTYGFYYNCMNKIKEMKFQANISKNQKEEEIVDKIILLIDTEFDNYIIKDESKT